MRSFLQANATLLVVSTLGLASRLVMAAPPGFEEASRGISQGLHALALPQPKGAVTDGSVSASSKVPHFVVAPDGRLKLMEEAGVRSSKEIMKEWRQRRHPASVRPSVTPLRITPHRPSFAPSTSSPRAPSTPSPRAPAGRDGDRLFAEGKAPSIEDWRRMRLRAEHVRLHRLSQRLGAGSGAASQGSARAVSLRPFSGPKSPRIAEMARDYYLDPSVPRLDPIVLSPRPKGGVESSGK